VIYLAKMLSVVNLADYLEAALGTATYERWPGATYYGTIPGFHDVWADAPTLAECQVRLREVLEDWLRQRLESDLDLPEVNGSMALVSTSYCPWQA